MEKNHSPEISTVILMYGKLLLETYSRSQSHVKNEELLKSLQIREEAVIEYLEKSHEAKTIFSFTNSGKIMESLEVSLVSFVAYRCLCTDLQPPTIAFSANVVCGDNTAILIRARRVAFTLAKKQIIKITFTDGNLPYNGFMSPTSKTLKFILGDQETPAVFNEKMVKGDPSLSDENCKGGVQLNTDNYTIPTAKELADQIRETCLGSYLDEPIRAIASTYVTHLHRARLIKKNLHPKTPNLVSLCIGSSSTGKSFVSECTANSANILLNSHGPPFASFSATDLTSEGYVGCSVEDILKPLLEQTSWDVSKARWGTVFLDEIDKKASRTTRGSLDIGGRNVQENLLRMLGGAIIPVGSRRSTFADQRTAEFNSDGTQFILAGAFVGLDELMQKNKNGRMGFGVNDIANKKSHLRECLVEYGLLPELVSRIGSVVVFKDPTISDLMEILLARQGMINCYRRLLFAMELDVGFTGGGIRLISEYGYESNSFARGMQSVFNRLTEQLVYEGKKGKVRLGVGEVKTAIESLG